MFKKRCQLCGGKLDQNICTLCGLDNSKSDANYKLNQGTCDNQPLTHVHTEEPPKQTGKKKNSVPKKKSVVKTKSVSKKKGSGKVFVIIFVIIILSQIFSALESVDFGTGGTGGIEEVVNRFTDDEEEEYKKDRYLFVTRELSDEGEEYEILLEEGTYIVGVHIPEGVYSAEENAKGTFDSFYLEDERNEIFFGESFNDDEENEVIEDVRCYSGAKLSVRGNIKFVTANAQMEEMSAIENPLTDPVTVKDGDIAGENFPAGTYDVIMQEGDTSFAYIVPGTVLDVSEGEEEMVTERFWIDTYEGEFVKRNLYLPEGTEIRIDMGNVHLVPSEKIPESYDGYYYIYE